MTARCLVLAPVLDGIALGRASKVFLSYGCFAASAHVDNRSTSCFAMRVTQWVYTLRQAVLHVLK